MKVLSILALGPFLALPLSVQAVPVNECVVAIGTFSGTG